MKLRPSAAFRVPILQNTSVAPGNVVNTSLIARGVLTNPVDCVSWKEMMSVTFPFVNSASRLNWSTYSMTIVLPGRRAEFHLNTVGTASVTESSGALRVDGANGVIVPSIVSRGVMP